MFHSAALKLTLWYLAIIMSLSIGCSIALYNMSSRELSRSIDNQTTFFDSYLGPADLDRYNQLRTAQADQERSHIRRNLLLFNVFVLMVGGVMSYALARRTLRPIEDSLETQIRFTGDASHELRTPLAAMQAEIEVALRGKDLSQTQALKLLRSNLEEVGKLQALSDGLLKLASGDNSISKERVATGDIVSGAIERHAKTADAKKIVVKKNIKNININGDKQSLVDLLSILLDNAIKYSPTGSQIRIAAAKKDSRVLITVADQGQGIAAEELPHIFERFYRADTSRSKLQADGYGLGLAIAKKIADLHNAFIEVKSTPNKGSIFTINLPAAT